MAEQLRVVVRGREGVFEPSASPIVLGRDAVSTIPIDNANVAPRHAIIRYDGGRWLLASSADAHSVVVQGSRRVSGDLEITGAVVITLGPPDVGERIELGTVATAAPAPNTPPSPAPPAPRPAPGRAEPAAPGAARPPAAPSPGGTTLVVNALGSSWRCEPSQSPVAIGSAADATVHLEEIGIRPHHVRACFDSGQWILEQGEPNALITSGARRVAQALPIDRETTIRLGPPDTGIAVTVSIDTASVPTTSPAPAPSPTVPGPTPVPVPGSGGGQTIRVTTPQLVVRIGTKSQSFPIGKTVRVGRDPLLEVVTDNPRVTRDHHGEITSDHEGATYTDTSSTGSFFEGKRLTSPFSIRWPKTIQMGDPVSGEELTISPPLSEQAMADNLRRARRRRPLLLGAVAAAAVIVVVVASVALAGGKSGPTPGPAPGPTPSPAAPDNGSQLSAAALAHDEHATVRLLQGSADSYTGWGTGTIINAHGLILTNGHVAQPDAPGEAVSQGGTITETDPEYLTVEMVSSANAPVRPAYRAKVVAVDGYVDLALVQIYADTNGTPIDSASLDLPHYSIGDVSALNRTQPLSIIGFPGVAQADTVDITTGTVTNFEPDELGQVQDDRFEIETDARIAQGNSGGAAITDDGALIGVPSLTVTAPGSGDVSWRVRSVTEAKPLIEAEASGQAYVSPYLGPAPAGSATFAGVGTDAQSACAGGTSVASGLNAIYIAYAVQGASQGTWLGLVAQLPDGSLYAPDLVHGSPSDVIRYDSGSCVTIPLVLGDGLPDGDYQTQLTAGPSLAVFSQPATFTVGSGAPGGSGDPSAADATVTDPAVSTSSTVPFDNDPLAPNIGPAPASTGDPSGDTVQLTIYETHKTEYEQAYQYWKEYHPGEAWPQTAIGGPQDPATVYGQLIDGINAAGGDNTQLTAALNAYVASEEHLNEIAVNG